MQNFFLSCLKFQRKNGYIFSAWGKLRLVEHHLLLELLAATLLRPSDIATRLGQPLPQTAHVLSSLKGQGLIREIGGNNKREKFILLTESGLNLIHELDDISNSLMFSLADDLDFKEQERQFEFWELLNNALGAPPTYIRPGDHPIRIQTRRFTRALGFFSRRPLPAEVSFPELSILFELLETPDGYSYQDLAVALHLPATTLKKQLQSLYERGYSLAPSNRAGSVVKITLAGAELLYSLVKHLDSQIYNRIPECYRPRLTELAQGFKVAIDNWMPNARVAWGEIWLADQLNYFERLQVPALEANASARLGVFLVRPDSNRPDQQLLIYDGPTPVFSLCYSRNTERLPEHLELLITSFGFSERADWTKISHVLGQYLNNSAPNGRATITLPQHLLSLRDLIKFDSEVSNDCSSSFVLKVAS